MCNCAYTSVVENSTDRSKQGEVKVTCFAPYSAGTIEAMDLKPGNFNHFSLHLTSSDNFNLSILGESS